jgi:hypothetical protein
MVAKNDFFNRVRSLTLEAWEAYQQELLRVHANREINTAPNFIQRIYNRRKGGNESVSRISDTYHTGLGSFYTLSFIDNLLIDWEY